MIRNSLIAGLLGLSVLGAKAFTLTVTLPPNSITNVFPLTQGSAYIYQAIITATTATNASVQVYDTPTNAFTYTNSSYNGRASYATNYITSWTNFYGVIQSTTNLALIDYTNTVSASTNNYPMRFSVAALASSSAAFPGINSYFAQGVWATNNGSGTATLTITGRNGE